LSRTAPAALTSEQNRVIELLFCLALFVFVIVSRALTSGPVYFADGPAHLAAIATRAYVIQPPGYWLFNRMASLFPNPEHAILVFNWLVSAAGAIVFYFLARRIVESRLARFAAVLYSVIFFAWFSGNVHSTYASQLLFPLLTIYLLIHCTEQPSDKLACAAGLSYAIGAGLRPSDGVFLAPVLLYFTVLRLPRRQTILCLATAAVACLAWFIPTQIALHRYGTITLFKQADNVADGALLLGRLNIYTASNALRTLLPLAVALGPLFPFAFLAKSPLRLPLWLAVLPGASFFLLFYIADAPYLNFLLGPLLLLCILGVSRKLPRSLATFALSTAIFVNAGVYFLLQPFTLPGKTNFVAQIVTADIVKYTRYGIRHRFMKRLRYMVTPTDEAH
jgi:4-amino-4-deoxy-L-arabinose transferase-like glycosyltransferase